MMLRALLLAAMLLAPAGGALAAPPDCEDNGPGLHISLGVHIGEPYTADEQEIFDKMYLRQHGIIAREAKRTAKGCIEAWVPNGKGGFTTEYYDPRTFEQKTFEDSPFRLQFD